MPALADESLYGAEQAPPQLSDQDRTDCCMMLCGFELGICKRIDPVRSDSTDFGRCWTRGEQPDHAEPRQHG